MQTFARPIIEAQYFGLNDAVPAEDLPPGYFSKIDNTLCSDGKISKVNGSTAINTSIASQPFNGLAAFEKVSSSSKWLVVSINGASNAQLYQSTGGNFSAIGSANLTNGKPVWFETANDILYGFNGSEEVDWDGTTVTKNRATLPIGYFAKWFHNYLFVGKTNNNPNRLFWSKIGDPTTFGGSMNVITVNSGGSNYVVGDILNVTGGGGSQGTITVTSVSSGVINGIVVNNPGGGYATGSGLSTTGGSGTSATININSVNSDFIDVNPGDSDQIMGLAPFQDELLVFKRNTIWSITGFSGISFSSTTLAAQNTNGRIFGYGTVAPFSIVPVGNEVYFFSMLGSTPVIRSLRKTILAATLGGGIISESIKGTLSNITLANLSQIAGSFDGRYCYWSIPVNGSATNNEIIVLDTWEINSTKGIYPFTTMSSKNASYLATSTIPGYSNIYFTDASLTSGLVFKFDSSVHTDNGVAITMDVRTRDYFYDPSRKAKYKYLYLTFDTGSAASVAVNARIDDAVNFTNQANISMLGNSPGLGPTGTFTLGISVLGGAKVNTTRITFAQLTGHYLGIEYKDTTSNSVVLHKWEIYGNIKGLRAD